MRFFTLFLSLIFLTLSNLYAQVVDSSEAHNVEHLEMRTYPKIGLSLSGGGARGLAHIAALRALDSVGLRVDYVTGTSVGAIMGSLYASGYQGKTIDSVAQNVDWDQLLSDDVPLRSLGMEEKDMNTGYAFDLPYRNKKFTLSRSILEGQGMWSELTEFLFPVMGINDFNHLQKGFKCVAADIATGDEVLLESGSIVDAVRASMAVPAAFAPVDIDGKTLIDGGVTRNLPVQELYDMGADYVIGIDLNHGGDAQLDFNNVFEVLLNIGFFSSNKDFQEQAALCDYHFSFDLRKYSAAAFESAPEIMQVGVDAMDSLVRHFSRIKDALESEYGKQPPAKAWNALSSSYKIDSLSLIGIDEHDRGRIRDLVQLEFGSHYTQSELKLIVDEVFSTNRMKAIHYNIYQRAENSYAIEFVVVPKERTVLDVGIQYNEFERINLVAKLFMHDVLFKNSRTTIGGAIGQNARFGIDHLQSINKKSTLGIRPHFNIENITLQNRDRDYEVNAQYRQRYRNMGVELMNLRNPTSQFVLGWKYENVAIEPSIFTDYILDGRSGLQSVELKYNLNTLNRKRMPTKGSLLHTRIGYVYQQNPKLSLSDANNIPLDLDTLGFGFDPYYRVHFDFDHYFKLGDKWTLNSGLKSYTNFSFKQNLVDNYQIGGLQKTFRNQVTMVGLDAADITTSSYSGIDLDLQYALLKNAFLHGRSSVGTYGYLNSSNQVNFDNTLAGFGLELQYNSLIGPIHLATTYSTFSQKLGYTIYLGLLF